MVRIGRPDAHTPANMMDGLSAVAAMQVAGWFQGRTLRWDWWSADLKLLELPLELANASFSGVAGLVYLVGACQFSGHGQPERMEAAGKHQALGVAEANERHNRSCGREQRRKTHDDFRDRPKAKHLGKRGDSKRALEPLNRVRYLVSQKSK